MTELSIEDKAATFDHICDLLGIGSAARTRSVVLTSIENIKRFSDYLHAVENEFFMVPGEPDEDFPNEEPEPVCLVNSWGSTKEGYIGQFRNALNSLLTAQITSSEE